MVILDKLKFWKKKEEEFEPEGFGALEEEPLEGVPGEPGMLPGEGMPPLPGEGPGPELAPMEGLPEEPGMLPGERPDLSVTPGGEATTPSEYKPMEQRAPPPVQTPQPAQPPQMNQMEVISAKLDAIRATLDSINVRLERIERATHGKEETRQTW